MKGERLRLLLQRFRRWGQVETYWLLWHQYWGEDENKVILIYRRRRIVTVEESCALIPQKRGHFLIDKLTLQYFTFQNLHRFLWEGEIWGSDRIWDFRASKTSSAAIFLRKTCICKAHADLLFSAIWKHEPHRRSMSAVVSYAELRGIVLGTNSLLA